MEEKKEQVASEEVSEAPEPVEEETTEAEQTEEEDSSSQIDYESELKVEKERREKAEKAAIEYKQKLKRISEKDVTETETETEDKPVTRAKLQQIIHETQDTTRKTLTETNAATIAQSISSSDAESQAILAKWHNRSFPVEVPLQEQMEEMHAAVNRKKLLSEKSELGRALKSKDTVSKDVAATHKDAPEGSEPKISAVDAQGLKGAGYVWDGVKRAWKKPLGQGKHLWAKDLASPTWIE